MSRVAGHILRLNLLVNNGVMTGMTRRIDEHNAGEPYQYDTYDEKKGLKPWKIIKLAFITGLESTRMQWELNSHYSVEQINNCAVPWLQSGRYGPRSPHADQPIQIWAGMPMSEVIRLIHLGKGEVYLSEAASR